MKVFKSFEEFNNWNYEDCGGKLVDNFTKTGNNFVVLDRLSGSYYCNPKYFETDINAKIYAKDNFILERVVIMLFDMEKYIASYKHLIGCEYLCNGMIGFVEDSDVGYYWVDNPPNLKNKNNKFYLDDETLGTYKEYMQLHYPEYKHVWSKQL